MSSREHAIHLDAGQCENLNLGELHLTITAYHPETGAHDIMRTVSLLQPEQTLKGADIPLAAMRHLIDTAARAVKQKEAE